jgi:hypothetical protein
MGLPWVRLDAAFWSHPKIVALTRERDGHRAGFIYVCALAYSGQHGTDGFLDEGCLPLIYGRVTDARLLVKYGLWRDEPGGWSVHGWDEKQLSNAETQERRKRAQAAAQARWTKGRKDA